MVEHASANAERAVLAQDGPPHIEQRDKRDESARLAPEPRRCACWAFLLEVELSFQLGVLAGLFGRVDCHHYLQTPTFSRAHAGQLHLPAEQRDVLRYAWVLASELCSLRRNERIVFGGL